MTRLFNVKKDDVKVTLVVSNQILASFDDKLRKYAERKIQGRQGFTLKRDNVTGCFFYTSRLYTVYKHIYTNLCLRQPQSKEHHVNKGKCLNTYYDLEEQILYKCHLWGNVSFWLSLGWPLYTVLAVHKWVM